MNKRLIKNKKNILREFDKEKYGYLLRKINNKTSLEKCDELINNDNLKKHSFKRRLDKKIIEKYIYKYSKGSGTILELGCGYGSIGLYLLNSNKFLKKKFIFLDISKNGILILIKIAANLNINKNKFITGFIDIYNCILDKKVNIPKNSIIFTTSAMHYRKKHNRKFINFFLGFSFKYLIFFEPIYEHNQKNKNISDYIKKNNYSQNFLKILKKENKIKIIFEKKNIYYSHKLLPYSLIVAKRH